MGAREVFFTIAADGFTKAFGLGVSEPDKEFILRKCPVKPFSEA
jgi:hypothetical protein